jgi:hypothetical protein
MHNIKIILISALLLNVLPSNGIIAAERVEDDGHGDVHRPNQIIINNSSDDNDDGHGDVHQSPTLELYQSSAKKRKQRLSSHL